MKSSTNQKVQIKLTLSGKEKRKGWQVLGLHRVPQWRQKFFVAKTEIPQNGEETIELLDYLLYLRNNETEEEIISELNDLIFTVCT